MMGRRGTSRGTMGLILGLVVLLGGFVWYMMAGFPQLTRILSSVGTLVTAGQYASSGQAIGANIGGLAQAVFWVAAAIAAVIILRRGWTRRKRSQLIIEPLRACGEPKEPKSTVGSAQSHAVQIDALSLKFRDQLVQVEGRISSAVSYRRREHGGAEGYQYGGPDKYQVSDDLARPLSRIQDASSGIPISVPENDAAKVGWAAQIVNLLFPPHQTTVRGMVRFDDQWREPRELAFEAVDSGSAGNNGALTFDLELRSQLPPSSRLTPGDILVEWASKVLAIELLREQLDKISPRLPWRRERFQARYHLMAGMLYTTYFKAYLKPYLNDHYPTECVDYLYERGCAHLTQAIQHDPTSYKAYAALADLHSIRGQAEQLGLAQPVGQQAGTATVLHYQAISEYAHAKELLEQQTKGLRNAVRAGYANRLYQWDEQRRLQPTRLWYRVRGAMAHGADDIIFRTASRLEYAHHKLLIRVGKARAQLLTEDLDEAVQAVADIWDIEEDGPHRHHKARLAHFPDYQALYYLACWHATAYRLSDDSFRMVQRSLAWRRPNVTVDDREAHRIAALRYLAYGLARSAAGLANTGILDVAASADTEAIEDPSWYYWKRVDNDPDFAALRRDTRRLKDALKRSLRKHPQLHKDVGPAFEDEITRIMVEAGVLVFTGPPSSMSPWIDADSLVLRNDMSPILVPPLNLRSHSALADETGTAPPPVVFGRETEVAQSSRQ
jgi:hypothetical protein